MKAQLLPGSRKSIPELPPSRSVPMNNPLLDAEYEQLKREIRKRESP